MTGAAVIDPVALAAELIRCPSVTPDDAGAITVLARALDGLGFTCEEMPFQASGTPDILNLWARFGAGGRHFCFAGHTDVVPVGDENAWIAAPFAGEVRDGFLIGRGAADMKGNIAAFVAATQRHLAANPGFDGSISLLITGDEEGPAVNGTVKMLETLAARGETIDACLVGEPTSAAKLGDTIKIGRRGSLNGYLTVYGTGGHTAYPHLADNPAHRLVQMLHRLTAKPMDQGTEHFEASTLQISTIDIGNPATNVIPTQARACFNIRFNDGWTGESVEEWLRDELAVIGGPHALSVKVSGESFLTPPGVVAELIANAVEEVTGRRPDLTTGGGTSDARFIQRYCPVAEFGLVGQTMHKVDERVPVEDIEALTRIYEGVLARFFAKG
ncbi:MAG TPA: succinyl-diaminopimelate desuccinylase [Stellaceae bacterium]|jgi:succinyl-diaminopimelate desuccinylase|nr:succinyl-diaminopimelate desuccinylase [Stellaceae bacterium]